MRLTEIWRYPVKSMRGEALDAVEIASGGIPGDRSVHLLDDADQLMTARTRPELLGLQATLDEAGEVLIDEGPWDHPVVADRLTELTGRALRAVRSQDGHRFDDTPLLVATDGAIDWIGVDRRRFRPNLVVSGVEGLAEREWPGRRLAIGETLISVEKVCRRCVMTTFDPDTLEQDASVLSRINDELDGTFALNCHVEQTGTVRVGDPVELC